MHQHTIIGLRQRFADGATFSGLLRYLLDQHPEEKVTAGMVREYIMEAFSVPFHQSIKMDVDNPSNDDVYAAVNAFLLLEIVSARSHWHTSPRSEGGEKTWMDNLQLTDGAQLQRSRTEQSPSGISEAGLAALSASERERLYEMEVGSRALWERVLVLARLAEQLQRKLCQLEKKPEAVKHD